MAARDTDPTPLQESESLDCALLESLFFQEMAMMEESLDYPSIQTQFNGAPPPGLEAAVSAVIASTPVASASDQDVAAEKDLLREFAVAPGAHSLQLSAQSSLANAPQSGISPDLPYAPPPVDRNEQYRIQMLSSNRGGIRHNVEAASIPSAPHPTPLPEPEAQKRKKLVGQFATLAERLGISLPPQVLDKLTNKTASRALVDEQAVQAAAAAQASLSDGSSSVAPVMSDVQSAAAESIALVSGKRAAEQKPLSKRRKKPRLPDCERRLSELQAENEMLKRHLDNISNRSQKLKDEQSALKNQLRTLLEQNAPDSQLAPIVHHYTEMFSDYGRKRHEELNFHLEQLQRLANPTDFTKMGLWTLGGQNSSNIRSLAGMLQQELGISPQQGRKILEQREKIRDVCGNLKECLLLLGKLKALCERKTQIFSERMAKVEAILEPKQVVKLMIWIDENSQTLESVCPGWGSEQFGGKVQQK